jgi:magnesium-transporting ATPase (P-type)
VVAGDHHHADAGAEVDALDDAALRAAAARVSVFARASPAHKLRLVAALQASGEVVAMTGDGVNDAPALKRAEIGVAMGARGTEAAKEAAAIVLADDDFATIAHAVEEGRTVYDNLRKAIAFILPTNGGQGLVVVTAVLLGLALPITPVQILWINMITAVTLALALAFEPGEADRMGRPPRRPTAPLLDGFLAWRVVLVSALIVAAVFLVFHLYGGTDGDVARARTMAVNQLVLIEVAYLLSSRRLVAPALPLGDARAAAAAIALVLLFQAAFIYLPVMQTLFGTAPLTVLDWLLGATLAAVAFAVVEAEKAATRARSR